MTQLDSTTVKAVQDYRVIRGELSHLIYQFCAGPWGHTTVVERVEGKIIIIIFFFYFLIISFDFYFYAWLFITISADYCVTVCSICSLLIHVRRLRSTRRGGPRPGSSSAICIITFARTALAPISSLIRSSRHWGPATRVQGKADEGLDEQKISPRWLFAH